ncbi:MAG: rubrerythrin family protein [Chloroflexi bacterium]|nr:rubrerythrin family protein [Chloroflexota bacterium]
MHAITAANLRNAHGGESMAHMRYLVWGAEAEKEGFHNVARLFKAISAAEKVHATSHFRELKDGIYDALCASTAVFGLGKTSLNLQGGIMGETYEITEMYPTYLETAKFQGEKGAEQSFHYALAAERTHAALFQKAKRAIDTTGKDPDLGPIQICKVCGWTYEGEVPDKCPICSATREEFDTFAPLVYVK